MPIKERKSVELFSNELPNELLNSQVIRMSLKIVTLLLLYSFLCQCFEISYNRQKCNLTIQQEYSQDGDKYCLENTSNKPKISLDCQTKKMGSEIVSITPDTGT